MDLFKDIRKLNISSYIIFIMQNFNISCTHQEPPGKGTVGSNNQSLKYHRFTIMIFLRISKANEGICQKHQKRQQISLQNLTTYIKKTSQKYDEHINFNKVLLIVTLAVYPRLVVNYDFSYFSYKKTKLRTFPWVPRIQNLSQIGQEITT